jgi:hypothetical protein
MIAYRGHAAVSASRFDRLKVQCGVEAQPKQTDDRMNGIYRMGSA